MTCRSIFGANLARIHTRAPQSNSTSINPVHSTRRRGDRRSRSGMISTGTIGPPSTSAGGPFGSSSRRHLNSWLAFTSCRRATLDTTTGLQRLGDNLSLERLEPADASPNPGFV
jgi:hypothetical protein